MNREEFLLKVLATGPTDRRQLQRDTGWGVEATAAVIDGLVAAGRAAYLPTQGNNNRGGIFLCLPASRTTDPRTRHRPVQ